MHISFIRSLHPFKGLIGISLNLAALVMLSGMLAAEPAPTGSLKVNALAGATQGELCVFRNTPDQRIDATVQNTAPVRQSLYYKCDFTGYDEKAWGHCEGEFALDAASSKKLALAFNPANWPLGPYDGKLELYLKKGDAAPVFTRTFRLGIVSGANLDKARPGEFLYGIDVSNSDIYPIYTAAAFAYYKAMGVDLLRNVFDKGMPKNAEGVGQGLKKLAGTGVQASVMVDPPRDADPARHADELAKRATILEEIGRQYGGTGEGKVRFFELGNEPDLFGFYPLPISSYVNDLQTMYDAVKRGTKAAGVPDSATTVMNGGLSFAGQEGKDRAKEFLKEVDPHHLDAIAYHGHGPGIEAERQAYEQVHAVAAGFGKANRPFVETESGYSGIEHRGLLTQARTAVEKMVYGQSCGLLSFNFFRLFMEGSGIEGGYGLTDNFVEPHPSILTYRNMVQQLRHHRFVKRLDIDGAPNIDTFLFAEQNADGTDTGRKVLVVFTEKLAQYDLLVHLAKPDARIDSPALVDMYGNSKPAIVMPGNIGKVSANADPVFLTWRSAGPAADVTSAPPLLSLEASGPVLAGADNPIVLTVRNVGQEPVDAKVDVSVQSRVSLKPDPAETTVTIAPGQAIKVPVILHAGPVAAQVLRMPMWWKVFVDANPDQLTPALMTAIPDEFPGKNGSVTGRFAWATGNHLDIGKLAGGVSEKRPAVAYTIIDSPQAGSLECAASADWWMAWYVNGVKVYDTLDRGNEGGSLADHTFALPLKQGRNIVVVQVLSGSQGWSLDFGGPKERSRAVSVGANDPDLLAVNLSVVGNVTARQAASLHIQEPVPTLGQSPADQYSSWLPLEPLVVLEGDAVKNLFMKEPDSSRWYTGTKDLSGTIWLRDDGKYLQLFAAITDDKLVEAKKPERLAQGDSLRVVLADDAGKKVLDVIGGLIADKPVLVGGSSSVRLTAWRQEKAGTDPITCYRLSIPKSLVGHQPFHLNLSVADNDAGYLKQTLDFGNVNEPRQGMRLITEMK